MGSKSRVGDIPNGLLEKISEEDGEIKIYFKAQADMLVEFYLFYNEEGLDEYAVGPLNVLF